MGIYFSRYEESLDEPPETLITGTRIAAAPAPLAVCAPGCDHPELSNFALTVNEVDLTCTATHFIASLNSNYRRARQSRSSNFLIREFELPQRAHRRS